MLDFKLYIQDNNLELYFVAVYSKLLKFKKKRWKSAVFPFPKPQINNERERERERDNLMFLAGKLLGWAHLISE